MIRIGTLHTERHRERDREELASVRLDVTRSESWLILLSYNDAAVHIMARCSAHCT